MNQLFEEVEEYKEFKGFKGFMGALDDGIWLRLIIEDVILDMQYSTEKLTALNVAKELITQGNVPFECSINDLLEACDRYLERYNDAFTDLRYTPYRIYDDDKSAKYARVIVEPTKNGLFKTHAAELKAHVDRTEGLC